MDKNYQDRDKFFYALPHLFPTWPYADRRAIGMKLDDFWASEDNMYRFKVNGDLYEISRGKALLLGKKYVLPFGRLPNIIPLAEFTRIVPKKEEFNYNLSLFQ